MGLRELAKQILSRTKPRDEKEEHCNHDHAMMMLDGDTAHCHDCGALGTEKK